MSNRFALTHRVWAKRPPWSHTLARWQWGPLGAKSRSWDPSSCGHPAGAATVRYGVSPSQRAVRSLVGGLLAIPHRFQYPSKRDVFGTGVLCIDQDHPRYTHIKQQTVDFANKLFGRVDLLGLATL